MHLFNKRFDNAVDDAQVCIRRRHLVSSGHRVRRVFTLLAACAVMGLHALRPAFAHGSWELHYNDCARVLNGFGVADGKDAKRASQTVANASWSPNAAEATKRADRAAGGFYDLVNAVSGRMDAMPHDLEAKFGNWLCS